jgi:hypothetical protein
MKSITISPRPAGATIMKRFPLALIGIAAVAWAGAASAQSAVDCSKSRNSERCEARQKARATCQDKRGAERRHCIQEHMPPPDCAKSQHPARCNALASARDACKDKVGIAHRQCLDERANVKP